MRFITEGQLISKSITTTQALLLKVFPAEFAARNVGHQINYGTTILGCNDFMNAVIPKPSTATINKTCNTYNFAKLETLRFFVNGTWFG